LPITQFVNHRPDKDRCNSGLNQKAKWKKCNCVDNSKLSGDSC